MYGPKLMHRTIYIGVSETVNVTMRTNKMALRNVWTCGWLCILACVACPIRCMGSSVSELVRDFRPSMVKPFSSPTLLDAVLSKSHAISPENLSRNTLQASVSPSSPSSVNPLRLLDGTRKPPMPSLHETSVAVYTEAELVCEEKFERTGDKCVTTEKFKATRECPEGWVEMDGKCSGYKKRKATYRCPEHYKYENKKCIKHLAAPVQLECPQGFILVANTCAKKFYTKPQLQCPEGSELDARECLHVEEVAGGEECPIGYRLENGTCVREVHEIGEYVCPPGYAMEEEFEPNWGGNLAEGGNPVAHNNFRGQFALLNPSPPSCVKTEYKQTIPACEHPAAVRTADYCAIRHISPTTQKCADHKHSVLSKKCKEWEQTCEGNANLEGDACVSYSKFPAIPTCELGFQVEGNECVRLDFAEPDLLCPYGSERVGGDVCEQVYLKAKEYVCEEGFKLEEEGICRKKKISTPRIFCKDEGVLISQFGDAKLTQDVPLSHFYCQHYTYIPPAQLCPPEMSLAEGRCESMLEQSKKMMCEEGFEHATGGECVKALRHPKMYTCPQGYTLDIYTVSCSKTTEKDPTPRCGEGLVFNLGSRRCEATIQSFDYIRETEGAKGDEDKTETEEVEGTTEEKDEADHKGDEQNNDNEESMLIPPPGGPPLSPNSLSPPQNDEPNIIREKNNPHNEEIITPPNIRPPQIGGLVPPPQDGQLLPPP